MSETPPSPPLTTCRVDFQPAGRRVDVAPGTTLLAAAQSAGVELVAVCGGAGSCGACRVRPISGALSPLTPAEIERLSPEEIAAGLRLACQAEARGAARVELLPEALAAPQRLQLEGAVLDVAPDPLVTLPPGGALAGLAVDVGTTKLAAYLVDLASGRTLARGGAMNPQIVFGEDVVSRIAYCNAHPDGRRMLRDRLAGAIDRLAGELCAQAGLDRGQVAAAVLAGNTLMGHLLAGLPVAQLGAAPYAPAVRDALELPAGELGLDLAAGARAYLPPVIAGFVGADHVAALLAALPTAPAAAPGGPTTLLVDIGTNTEISLLHRGRLLTCSCASGPAFEGAHIRDGMRAAPGAVERVRIHAGEVRVQAIGGRAPVGICGSGILDAVAELYAAGLLDARGALRLPGGGREFTLVPAAQTGHGRDLVVTRRDIHEIQLAKAAIRAGTEILLHAAGIPAGDIEELIVAGAFGTYLSLESAVRVGMFPPLPLGRFRQVGNAAGSGARHMLVSRAQRCLAEAIARRTEYVELTTYPDFSEEYVNALGF